MTDKESEIDCFAQDLVELKLEMDNVKSKQYVMDVEKNLNFYFF